MKYLFTPLKFRRALILLTFLTLLITNSAKAQQLKLSRTDITINEPSEKDTSIAIDYELVVTKEVEIVIKDVTSNSATPDKDYIFKPGTIKRTIDPAKEQPLGSFKIAIKSDHEIKEGQENVLLEVNFRYKGDTDYLKDFIRIKINDAVSSPMGDASEGKLGEGKAEAEQKNPEEKLGSRDMTLHRDSTSAVYKTELLKNAGLYYVRLCGTDKSEKKDDKGVVSKLSKDTCVNSDDKISNFENNSDSFTTLMVNALKKFDTDFKVNDTTRKEIGSLYTYYQKEMQKKETQAWYKEQTKEGLDRVINFSKEPTTAKRVAKICIANTSVKIKDGVNEIDARIDSIKIQIDKGTLAKRQLQVYTSEGKFINREAPVSLVKFGNRTTDHIENYDARKTTFVILGDVLSYDEGLYIPDDVEELMLTADQPCATLSAATNLNSLLNVAVFTDLPGLLGRKPNGIIQTDVSSRIITNSRNFWNHDWVVFSYLEAKMNLSKLDSKYQSLDSAHVKFKKPGSTEKDTVDRSYLNQIAWLRGELKLNLLRARLAWNQFIYLNAAAQINVTNGDSLYKKDLFFFNYYPELVYTLEHLGSFGVEISSRWLRQRLSQSTPFSNIEHQRVWSPQVMFFYNPSGKRESRIFLKWNYFDFEDKQNSYHQFQFGWKTNLKLTKE